MFRPIAVNVGLRYARSKRSFISFVSVLALAGLALAVAILVFVQAVAEGFERELEQRILRIAPHVTAAAAAPVNDMTAAVERARAVPGVRGASAVVSGMALVAAGERVAGVLLSGVVPREYAAVSDVFDYVAGDAPLEPGAFRIVLGATVAARLGVAAGDAVTVASPRASVNPFGVFPRQKRFAVAGIMATGSQLDGSAALAHRADAARLLGDDAAGSRIDVALARPLAVHEAIAPLIDALGAHRFAFRTWTQSFGALHRAIDTTKGMLFLLLSLLVAVAAFNLVSSLVMVVNERRGDVAVLRTVGGSAGQVVAAFMVLGGLIALIGILGGVAVGVALGTVAEAGFPWLERVLGVPLMAEYLVTELPMAFTAGDIARVVATAFVLCLAACIFPAWRASRLNPADVLQHE